VKTCGSCSIINVGLIWRPVYKCVQTSAEQVKELNETNAASARTAEEVRKEAGRLQQLAETHNVRANLNQNLLDQYKWLDEVVEYQRNVLWKYVLVERCEINSGLLTQGKRFVELTFHVVNYSMFKVSIPMRKDAVIEGSIYFKGDRLSGEAKLTENRVIRLEPHMSNYFKIHQWVNSDEARDIPETLEKVGNFFGFSEAIVYIKADKFSDDKPASLDLTRAMQNAELENKIIELENANTRLNREIKLRQERAEVIEELQLALGACYQAYNQTERGERLTEEGISNLKMRVAYALSKLPHEPQLQFEIYDGLPSPDSIEGQNKWVDSLCFKLRDVIKKQRQELSDEIQQEPQLNSEDANSNSDAGAQPRKLLHRLEELLAEGQEILSRINSPHYQRKTEFWAAEVKACLETKWDELHAQEFSKETGIKAYPYPATNRVIADRHHTRVERLGEMITELRIEIRQIGNQDSAQKDGSTPNS
jgi:hypothetical protein